VNTLYAGEKGEQQRLAGRCFQTAVHREWDSPGGTTTSVWLIQFGTAAGARSYIIAIEQAAVGDPTYPNNFRVGQVTDGMGFGDPKLDTYGNTLARVVGDAGNVAILIDVWVPARTDYSAAASILKQQSRLLTSGSS
jgi:hypothetical protein